MAVKKKSEDWDESLPGELQIGYIMQLSDRPVRKRKRPFKFGFQKTKKGKE